MKVFIESTPVFGQRTGVAQYIKRLIDAAVKLDEKNSYTAFGFLFFGYFSTPTALLKVDTIFSISPISFKLFLILSTVPFTLSSAEISSLMTNTVFGTRCSYSEQISIISLGNTILLGISL